MDTTSTSSFGKTMSILATVFGIFLGIGIVIGSLMLFKKKYEKVTGKLTNAVCKRVTDKTASYDCDLEVAFSTVDGSAITTKTLVNSNTYYNKDQEVVVYYLVSDPNLVYIGEAAPGTTIVGWILAGFGVLVFFGSIIALILTMHKSSDMTTSIPEPSSVNILPTESSSQVPYLQQEMPQTQSPPESSSFPQEQYPQDTGALPPQEQYPQDTGALPPQEQYPQDTGAIPPQEQYPQDSGTVPPQEQYPQDTGALPSQETGVQPPSEQYPPQGPVAKNF